ncbi:MAG TPA: hypothetical protein DDZ78_07070 [Porphyromonadaceae bacterium]|jgi:hypothetical protein|nr:hypothetical protein [Porphyromonadaceae bacterium]
MKKVLLFFCLCLFFTGAAAIAQESTEEADSVSVRFMQQLYVFPQEKIYLQTDKSDYLSGEQIRFRAHLVNAADHKPVYISRYVYVEIINPADDVVKRVKIRPDSTGSYHGYLNLADDLPEGAYTLRAYTKYMRNQGEDYFFRKTVRILNPFSLQLGTVPSFVVGKNNVQASFRFVDVQKGDTVTPEIVSWKLKGKPVKTVTPTGKTNFQWKFQLPEKEKNRSMLISLVYKNRKYNRYYTLPYAADDFEVAFFPEGGYMVPAKTCQVAFKSLNTSGLGEDISGNLYNSKGEEIVAFESLHLGMGFFNFVPAANETYYAVCKNTQGVDKRFALPAVQPGAKALSARFVGAKLIVALQSEAKVQEPFSLLIHQRGQVLYHAPWNPATEVYTFPATFFPSGVISILLLDARKQIISERMVFTLNETDFPAIHTSLSKPSYTTRDHILLKLNAENADSVFSAGSIAVSVTDNHTVALDTTIDIVSTLLLSSDLKGYIESPASYFRGNKMNKYALDALMMTQGWRRYDIPAVLRGDIQTPDAFAPEVSQQISGKADGLFRSLKEGHISLLASLDSLVTTEMTQTDDKGRFTFNVEFPEGTAFTIQSLSKKGNKNNLIEVERESFPESAYAGVPERLDFANGPTDNEKAYLEKANEAYIQKYGIRTIDLEEITVTGHKPGKYEESVYYSALSATGLRTAEDIEKMAVSSLKSLLYTQPGIVVRSDKITTSTSQTPVAFIIDNITYEDFFDRLDDIDVSSIDNLFVVKDNSFLPGYFPNTNGAIVITTKMGYEPKPRKSLNIEQIIPLGYQQAAEFYSPVYETPEQKNASAPDLRTTIYWKPNVRFSEDGEATVDFYSADSATTYTVTGEGVSGSGKMIRFSSEIQVKGKDEP